MAVELARMPALRTVPRQAETDAQVLQLWLHGKSPCTQRAYVSDLRRFDTFVGRPLAGVTLGDLQEFADALEGSGLAPSSQARTLASVKSLLSFASRIGYTQFNIGAALRLPAAECKLAERIVTQETLWRIIHMEPSARNKLLLRMMYVTAARVSEVATLEWRNLSEREKGGQASLYGKGRKTRSVLIPANIWADLQASHNGAAPDDPVFVSRKHQALTTSAIWRICKLAGKRAGVEGFSPHWLRHAGASHSLDGGAPISVVQAALGHSSMATTGRYLHAKPGEGLCTYLPAV
jgi:site-specific recombinase XerD